MAAIESKHSNASECADKKQIEAQNSKKQAWGDVFILPMKFKELLGFLSVFLVTGILLGAIVTAWFCLR